MLVTYCTVCRTGRVFSPLVDGKSERFRLVGMDNFNAMFEDATTGSWWRQATGAAVAGTRKGGRLLTVIPSQQLTLHEWLALHPASLVMQADEAFADEYAEGRRFRERNEPQDAHRHRSRLVEGEVVGGRHEHRRAQQGLRLESPARERVINDAVGGTPIVLVLAADGASFFAFERPDVEAVSSSTRKRSSARPGAYTLWGTSSSGSLKPIAASQEFWHSWRTFHPDTERY